MQPSLNEQLFLFAAITSSFLTFFNASFCMQPSLNAQLLEKIGNYSIKIGPHDKVVDLGNLISISKQDGTRIIVNDTDNAIHIFTANSTNFSDIIESCAPVYNSLVSRMACPGDTISILKALNQCIITHDNGFKKRITKKNADLLDCAKSRLKISQSDFFDCSDARIRISKRDGKIITLSQDPDTINITTEVLDIYPEFPHHSGNVSTLKIVSHEFISKNEHEH
jgi:hypothetical protein